MALGELPHNDTPRDPLAAAHGMGLDHHCATATLLSPRSAKLALRMMSTLTLVPPVWSSALQLVLEERASASDALSGSDLMALTVMENRFFDRVARMFESKHQREARSWLDSVIFDAALHNVAKR